MDSKHVMRELELAAWEMAEAESHERAAHALRIKAMKRTSAVHAELKAATTTAIERRKNKNSNP